MATFKNFTGFDEGTESELAQFVPQRMGAANLSKRDNFELERKEMWRRLIESRINARLSALADSKGMAHVSDKVSALMENALQVRLKRVVNDSMLGARRRNDANKSAFKPYHVESDPRQRVRELNLRKQEELDAREEKKRQLLLAVSHAGDKKRKATVMPSAALVARQVEDERASAEKANRAASNALGMCRMDLKWAKAAKTAKPANDERAMPPPPPNRPHFKATAYTLIKQDRTR